MAILISADDIDDWLADLDQHAASGVGFDLPECLQRLIQIGHDHNDFAVQKRHTITRLDFSALRREIAVDGISNLLVLLKLV